MEPYEKWHRIRHAYLENGEKFNKDKALSSGEWHGRKSRDGEQSYDYEINRLHWSQGCEMAYVLLKNFFPQAFKQVPFVFHERLYYNYLIHFFVLQYELLHVRGSKIINFVLLTIYTMLSK